MTVDLYYLPASAPCRAVMVGAEEAGVSLNLKVVDVRVGDHLKPDYLKMNPQHTIPTLNDNGFILVESRAILAYFVNKYAKDDSLYPKDPKKRAMVDQKLNFDIGTLYNRFADYYVTQIFAKAPADPEKFKKLEEAFGFLDTFLEGQEWVAGTGNFTIADISIATTVSTPVVLGFPLDKYKNVSKWYERCKKIIPSFEVLNREGLLQFKELFDSATQCGKKCHKSS